MNNFIKLHEYDPCGEISRLIIAVDQIASVKSFMKAPRHVTLKSGESYDVTETFDEIKRKIMNGAPSSEEDDLK